jgi:hypothetical protein
VAISEVAVVSPGRLVILFPGIARRGRNGSAWANNGFAGLDDNEQRCWQLFLDSSMRMATVNGHEARRLPSTNV